MDFLDPRLPDRFWAKCIPEPNSGCWLWIATSIQGGYGMLRVGSRTDGSSRMALAHRVAYEALVGPIPFGLEMDHRVCQTPACCNPAHLEPVPHVVNVLRGAAGAHLGIKTHCPKGHVYDRVNTRIYRGGRSCRACNRARPSRKRKR